MSPTLATNLEEHRQYCVVDVETTGLNSGRDAIVEIAALRFVNGKVLDAYETLVNPGVPIPALASAIHLLEDDDVADAPCLDEVADDLVAFVGTDPILAHNAAFDKAFLPMLWANDWLCTQRLARRLWPNIPSYRNSVLRYWLRVRHPLLKMAAPHRAFTDALTTGLLFERAMEVLPLEFLAPPTMRDVIEYAEAPVLDDVFCYGTKHDGKRVSEIPSNYLLWLLTDALKPSAEREIRLDCTTEASLVAEIAGRVMRDPFSAMIPAV